MSRNSEREARYYVARVAAVKASTVVRAVLSSAPEGDGHQAQGASTISEAMELCDRQQFDLLVCDSAEFANGGSCELMRAVAAKCRIRGVLIVAEHPTPEQAAACNEAGFAVLLDKPVTFDQVRDALLQVTAMPLRQVASEDHGARLRTSEP